LKNECKLFTQIKNQNISCVHRSNYLLNKVENLKLVINYRPLSFSHELVPEPIVGIEKVPGTAKQEDQSLSLGHEGSYLMWAVELSQWCGGSQG
jgi:hypothetical protein